MSGDPGTLLLLGFLVLLVVIVVVAVADMRPRTPRTPPRPEPISPLPSTGRRPQAAVVVNPTKFPGGLDTLHAEVEATFLSRGWSPPLWMETTAEDTGRGQTRTALDAGVDVVLACGGDGTVRAVGGALAGTGVPLGLLPAGTGNLLARNLDVPVADLGRALDVTFTGSDHAIDVGRMLIDRSGRDRAPEEHAFLVMAGMGFDAAVMIGVEEVLKARIGPAAYVLSGLQALRGPQTKVRIQVDDRKPMTRRMRAVIVGNCGRLVGGVALMPAARVDDGWLDAVVLSPRGIVSWAAVTWQVVTAARRGHPRVEHLRCRRLQVVSASPTEVQLDGDPLGGARRLVVEVDPGALLVRVPAAPTGVRP
ncbi:diacylglycerol/lipid kinase family protein [Kineococcus xinjiangensis]|uniref:diacylglycerol/lipid kinase family protein n=1 Tax=Kineococcus xinjiangensis TaxID=512762 RepID=UPI001B80ABD0|nr:diacylglycerol kinase family protein [Kineococcus xinjiangensis]